MVPPGSVSSPMTRWRSMEPGSCLLYGFVGKSTGIQGNQKEVGVLGFNFPIKLWDLVNLYQPAPSINKSSRIWGDIPSPSIKHTPEWFSQGGLHIWDHRMGYLLWGDGLTNIFAIVCHPFSTQNCGGGGSIEVQEDTNTKPIQEVDRCNCDR